MWKSFNNNTDNNNIYSGVEPNSKIRIHLLYVANEDEMQIKRLHAYPIML